MNITLQDALTAAVVLIAVAYVIRRVVRSLRRKGLPACGCCGQCAAPEPDKPLVKLDTPPRQASE